jgi:TorA maturation chaperone TorD
MPDNSPIDWKETLTGEILLLRMLSRIFYTYPNNEERTWLQSLIEESVFSEVPFAAEIDETKAGLKLLQKWGGRNLSDESFEHMQADYTRLFIGPGKVTAAPWESVYLGEDRLVFQKQTLEVRTWYKRFGLEAERIHQEPDDHIGLELLFLSHLAYLGINALDDQDNSRFEEILEAKREFFKKHTGKWVLKFCELIKDNAQTDFYKGVAHLTRGAMSTLAVILDVELVRDSTQ